MHFIDCLHTSVSQGKRHKLKKSPSNQYFHCDAYILYDNIFPLICFKIMTHASLQCYSVV